jgi:hypothetical protein
MWYNLHARILALRAIRFKFHGRLKQRPIGFQSVTQRPCKTPNPVSTLKIKYLTGKTTHEDVGPNRQHIKSLIIFAG